MDRLRNSENVWVLGIFLGVTGLLAALVLSLVSQWTAKPIAEAERSHRMLMLRQLNLPDFDNDPSQTAIPLLSVNFMAAEKGGKIVGYIAETSVPGYGGAISGMVSYSADGKILAVQILKHKETPGLGAAVCERKFPRTLFNFWKPLPTGLPPNRILDQFNGKSAEKAKTGKLRKDGGEWDFQTGATVTSRAVAELVRKTSTIFPVAQSQLQSEERVK